jgi:hypothetical protein
MKIWINRAGQNVGTFTQEEVQQGLNDGRFVATDLAWQEGMETWKPLSEFPGVQVPPPQPPNATFTESGTPFAPSAPPAMSSQPLATITPAIEDGPPWEHRKELGIWKALVGTWKEVLLRPSTSFPVMKSSGGFGTPVGFNLVMLLIWAVPTFLYSFLTSGLVNLAALEASSQDEAAMHVAMGLGPAFSAIVVGLMIPIGIASTFINAGLIHLCLSLFKGTSKQYEATFRVVSYSSSSYVLAVVPFVGSSVSGIWCLVSMIIGLSKVHKTEPWRAAASVLLPIFLCCAIVFAAYIALIAILFAAHGRTSA